MLAEVAAIRWVCGVIGLLHLAGADDFVLEAKGPDQLEGDVALV